MFYGELSGNVTFKGRRQKLKIIKETILLPNFVNRRRSLFKKKTSTIDRLN